MSRKSQNRIFVSYSHRDKTWLDRVQVHLRPLTRSGVIDLWDDTKIAPGTLWREDISSQLSSAKAAIFLVSADFLASDFINSEELPSLLTGAEQRGVRLLSVILSPCSFSNSPLGKYQSINPANHSLLKMSRGEQEEVFAALASFVRAEFQMMPEDTAGQRLPNDLSHTDTTDLRFAESLLLTGNFEQAVQEVSSILCANPNCIDALLIRIRANAYIFRGADKILEDATRVIALTREYTDSVSMLQYADALISLRHSRQAIERASIVIAREPSNQRAYRIRMLANILCGRNAEAITDGNVLLQVNPNNGYVWYRMSHAYSNMKNYANAVQCANSAIESIPNYWIIYDRRGGAYSALGYSEDALSDLSKVLESAPWYNSSRRLKAAILLDLKRYPESLVEISLALMFEPRDAVMLSMQAEVFMALGDYIQAIKSAKTALSYNPNENSAMDVLVKLQNT